MNINMNITANLTPEDVNEIVKNYLENQGYSVETIKAKIGKRTIGHQMNEYEESFFEGMEAKISKKPEKTYSQFDR